MKHSPAECEWGLRGDFFKAISPRSVKSYSHLGEIKDISVRGSWQGLSTARLALGFRFPTWIRSGGSRGAALPFPLPSAGTFPGARGARNGLCLGIMAQTPGVTCPESPRAGEQPPLSEPMAGRGAVPCVMVTKAVTKATDQLSPSGQSMPCLPSAQGTGTAQRGAFLGMLGPWQGAPGVRHDPGVADLLCGAAKSLLRSFCLGGIKWSSWGPRCGGITLMPGGAPGVASTRGELLPLLAALGCFQPL